MGLLRKSEKAPKRRSVKKRWVASCLTVTIISVIVVAAGFCWFALQVMDLYQAMFACGAAVLLGVAFVCAIAWVNLHFIDTITGPIKALTDVADRISRGSYGIQAEKPGNDELGDLFDSINAMSRDIAASENTRNEFISSVSHELRTPLTAITGWAETIGYDPAIQGDSARGVAIISKEAGRLTKMVGELLEFTRIQGGRFNMNMERMDVGAELEDTVFSYRELLKSEGMELDYDCPDELPMIEGDPERLKQVFLNVIDNAAKYGKGGKTIEVRLAIVEQNIIITVRDHGPGIPEEELPHVKEKFYKGSSKERGSGIGLAVCDEIMTRHCGKLTVENAQGGGTLVTIELPLGNPNNSKGS